MTMFVVRRVDVSDAAVAAAIDSMIDECFKPGDWKGERLPRAKTGYWWVAFEGRHPVAFACLRPSVKFPETGYLSVSGVLPKWRGHGLQKRLIVKRVQFARTLGWHTVNTDTMHDNAPSMRSLIACGFRPFSPTVKWGDPDHAVYWTRPTERALSD